MAIFGNIGGGQMNQTGPSNPDPETSRLSTRFSGQPERQALSLMPLAMPHRRPVPDSTGPALPSAHRRRGREIKQHSQRIFMCARRNVLL